MKASVAWLREMVPALRDLGARAIADELTGVGLEVEGIHEYGEATDACVVARVTAVRPHPSKSGLRLVTVDRGGGTQEVVCGAPNVPDPGGLVVLAPLGARLPAKDLVIARRAIGGVESEGMLCSEDELGLGDDHDGILVLGTGNTGDVGAPLSRVLPSARDTVLEIGLTPNRPDGLGHVGLARELAAILKVPLHPAEAGAAARTSKLATADVVTVAVDDPERCPCYGASFVEDVTIGPSPAAWRHRLQALGVRSISNVVDVTNLAMLESGHPMHAFDLDRLPPRDGKARVGVRRARDGEILKTLDGEERKLVADDLVITDGDAPIALAGVMGGASSEIQAATKRVLFECAYFDPRSVRRSARRHGLHTESSHRFERGVDPGDVARVLDRAVAMTLASSANANANAARGASASLFAYGASQKTTLEPPPRRSVSFRGRRVREVCGIDVPFAESVAILERLGCERSAGGHEPIGVAGKDESCDFLVPTHRPDLGREVDLVEEVIRVHGIDRVPPALPAIHASRDVGGHEELARRARAACVAIGLSEALTFAFTSKAAIEALRAPAASVVLANPMGAHHAVMRTTMLAGLLDALAHARRHGERDFRAFAIGNVFLPSASGGSGAAGARDLPREELRAGVVLAGDRPAWLEKPQPLDAWDAKGYAEALAERLAGAGAVRLVPAAPGQAPPHLHPRGAGLLEVAGPAGGRDGARVGSFGPLHPDVVDALSLDGEAFVVELSLERFTAPPAPRYAAIPRFPAATRDVAFIVRDGVPAGDVEAAVREAAGPLGAEVRLFDRFTGGAVGAGASNLAFHVIYRSPDRTLTDAEVDAAHANVVKVVGARFGATLRA